MYHDLLYKHKEKHIVYLLENNISFWMKHGIDTVYGGLYTGLDQKGKCIETDKSVWFQGRAAWIFSYVYMHIDADVRYLRSAQSLIDFIDAHCFDTDKKMFFRVTADGKPVVRRERYIFSETFAILAYASYAQASGEQHYIEKARMVLHHINYMLSEKLLISKFNQNNRATHSLGLHMILINTLQELRKADSYHASEYTVEIRQHIDAIQVFVRDDMQCVLEQVDIHGQFMSEHIEGRLLNPGHAIEAGWFILQEALWQKDTIMQDFALKIISYAWQWGWDTQYGGMLYFRDALEYPVSEYWHDMKFWWPHNEAVIAFLMAYQATKKEYYWQQYEQVLQWAYDHFCDDEYGEWFGYLHRDGSISTTLKGNIYKGPFHIPRMHIMCIQILRELLE